MSEIVVSNPESKKKKPPLAGILLAVAVVLLAAAGGIGARWLQSHGKDSSAGTGIQPLQKNVTASQNKALSGDFAGAHKELDDALKSQDLSKEDRYQLYYQQGATYDNEKKYDQALTSYKQAAAIEETQNIYASMAATSEAMGNKEQAISYYKKAIQFISSKNPVGGQEKDVYQQKIRDLGGQP